MNPVVQVLWLFVPAYLANMTPVLVRGHFEALARPIDGGRCFRGVRIFGDHKTWRGLLGGVVGGVLVWEVQRALWLAGVGVSLAPFDYGAHPFLPGFLLGLGTGIGDAVKSFFKRRVGIPPGHSWLVFDQLDFMVGAYVFLMPVYTAPLLPMLAALPVVLAGGVLVSAIGYWLRLREAWI